jgi:hypothetical protein
MAIVAADCEIIIIIKKKKLNYITFHIKIAVMDEKAIYRQNFMTWHGSS